MSIKVTQTETTIMDDDGETLVIKWDVEQECLYVGGCYFEGGEVEDLIGVIRDTCPE